MAYKREKAKYSIAHEVVTMLNKNGKCINNRSYIYDTCMYEKLHDLSMHEIGCTTPWSLNQSNICTNKEDSKKAYKLYTSNRRNQNLICPFSCNFTDVILSPPIIEGPGPHVSKARNWRNSLH